MKQIVQSRSLSGILPANHKPLHIYPPKAGNLRAGPETKQKPTNQNNESKLTNSHTRLKSPSPTPRSQFEFVSQHSQLSLSDSASKRAQSALLQQWDTDIYPNQPKKQREEQAPKVTQTPSAHSDVKPHKGNKAVLIASFVALFIGLAIFGWTIYTNNRVISEVAHAEEESTVKTSNEQNKPIETPITEEEIRAHRVAPDEPKIIRIEKLGVNARVMQVKLTKDYAIGSPSNIFDAGWYNGSSKPGKQGASLLVGHYSGSTKDGVFSRLSKLEKNDEFEVELGDSTVQKYLVEDKKRYDANNVDLAAALTPIDASKPGLNLITCGGKFDSASGMYQQRDVVFASLIE